MFDGKNIKLYHHVYLNEDKTWIFILLDQIKYIEDHNLTDYLDSYIVNVVGDSSQLSLLKKILEDQNCEIFFDKNGKTERCTLKKLWLESYRSECCLGYIHTKGTTYFQKFIKDNDIDYFRNSYYWRKFNEWSIIENWKSNIFHLYHLNKDIVGCNFNEHPFRHFSGNMWWAKSSYIKTLDDIDNCLWWKNNGSLYQDRLLDEMWSCSNTQNYLSISSVPKSLQSPNKGLYSKAWLRKYYV